MTPLAPQPAALWFVCHTKPRCEKKFAALLERETCKYSLPLVTSERRYGARVRRSTKPLFPGYVFAQIAPERRPRIYQQELLVRLLPVTDESTFLCQLAAVQAIADSGMASSVHPLLKHGSRVRIVSGPLKGVEGMVENPHSPKGVVISMDVLQQGVLVAVALADLKILPG